MSTLDMRLCQRAPGRFADDPGVFAVRPPSAMQVAALTASLSHVSTVLASASWTGLKADVNAVRPDLDHEVRVDLMLGSALVVPGHHILTDPEPWRARSTPHTIISSSTADVLQVRTMGAGLSS